MSSAIFSTATDCYQVSNVVYAGPVSEIPEERRRNGSTHRFKILTTLGPVLCCYKDEEAAKKARTILGAMFESLKPNVFRSGGQAIDTKKVVSFTRTIQLKTAQNGKTHGFIVTLEAVPQEKSNQVWLTYTSEQSADKARKALYAAIHSANGFSLPSKKEEQVVGGGDNSQN